MVKAGAFTFCLLRFASYILLLAPSPSLGESPSSDKVILRAEGVQEFPGGDVNSLADLEILDTFQRKFPQIVPVATTGLEIPGSSTMDIRPLMQIAGNIAPDVMYVNFRQSDTYVSNKFLYPLEEYIERDLGENIQDGHLLRQYVKDGREVNEYYGRLREILRRRQDAVEKFYPDLAALRGQIEAYGGQLDRHLAAEVESAYPELGRWRGDGRRYAAELAKRVEILLHGGSAGNTKTVGGREWGVGSGADSRPDPDSPLPTPYSLLPTPNTSLPAPNSSLRERVAAIVTAQKSVQLDIRVPRLCWEVIRRRCPYSQKEGQTCPYLAARGLAQAPGHYHIWAYPYNPVIMTFFYRKDLFADAGLPDRPPRDLEEMLEWGRLLTNPKEDRYGVQMELGAISWPTLSVLYSLGGRVVEQDAQGQWRCVFDSEEAVEAYYFVARMFLEEYTNASGKQRGIVYLGASSTGGEVKCAMKFDYIYQKFFAQNNPAQWGFGPVPLGPTGIRGSEFNAGMFGIYAGLDRPEDRARRDAAWEYISFADGPDAKRIRATVFVENGQAQFIRPPMLVAAGFPEYARQVPSGWEEAYQAALRDGVPEPYGKNCQLVYNYVSEAIDQLRSDSAVKAAIDRGAAGKQAAKDRIREILKAAVIRGNQKMLNRFSDEPYPFGPTIGGKQLVIHTFDNEMSFRNAVAIVVAAAILLTFGWVFYRVFKVFSQVQGPITGKDRSAWQFGKFKWAYILMAPALGSIALWAYYPLARGTAIAFQDYNVRGFSEWVGMENFANVLFDESFWYAMWVSLKYTLLYMIFGFGAPIVLAFLLTEVPKGKIVYRTIYYLPAVLTGVIVMFLWKQFYGQYGMINQLCNYVISFINWAFSWAMSGPIEEMHVDWLSNKHFALLFCLLPSIWAGMGPGCLIYLAALKTVPDDIYEAADIDGAGIWGKMTNVALPSIKALILINFIGAMIGAMKSGAQFMLAMTGGGPHTPYGETEVIGLHIFWQAYGYLRFGSATAMAWILGSLLIGFTVYRLQQLSRMEFRTAG